MAVKDIDAVELKKLLDKDEVLLIDVREIAEYETERVEGGILLPLSTFDPQDIPKSDKKLIIMCQHGVRSANVCHYLAQNDFADAINLRGGIEAWKKAGFAVSR